MNNGERDGNDEAGRANGGYDDLPGSDSVSVH
jgi:hypothetical protein